jgi:hypothetical protein
MFKQLLSLVLFEKRRQEPAEAWEHWFCVGTCCVPTMWLVQRRDNVWQIRASQGGPAWKMATDQPICPRCGGRLQAAVRSFSLVTRH